MNLSIVTINFNNKYGLQKTIESVSSQKINDNTKFEYIIIDAMSNDGSDEIIKDSSKVTKFIIEKDNGIADAFNKGIKLINYEYIYFK